MKILLICASLLLVAEVALASSRQSADYSIPADAIDAGGENSSSASYQQTNSAGLISDTSSAAQGVVLRSGYVAQLFTPLEVLSAVSRKTHGSAGTFDIALPLGAPAGIECRSVGAGGNHQVVVTFGSPITINGLSVMSRDGQAGGAATANGNIVTVNLTAVANAQTLLITLLGASNGSTTADLAIPMGVLAGDTNGDGTVNSGDSLQTRSRSGQALGATNFRSDVNVDGAVNTGDSLIVRSRSGSALP